MILQVPLDDQQVMVFVRLPAAIWADSIHLVGDFNGWSTSATPMRLGEHYWEATVTMPTGGTSYYAYLVDGVDWCSDYPGGDGGKSPQLSRFLPIAIQHARRRSAAHDVQS